MIAVQEPLKLSFALRDVQWVPRVVVGHRDRLCGMLDAVYAVSLMDVLNEVKENPAAD